nr:hypothetical protein [Yoonia sp.]
MANTQISTMLATTAVLALAACGGGGSTPVEISPERIFSDGAGVARGVATDGDTVLIISDEIGFFVDSLQTEGVSSGPSSLPSDFAIVQTLTTNANIRQGAINSGSLVANVTIVEDLSGKTFSTILEIPGLNTLFASRGDAYRAAPAGSFTYNGTFVTGLRNINPQLEYGSFSLNTNFNNQTFTINGFNSFDTLSGSGVVNTSTGELASNTLTMNTSGTNRSASLYGSLHGNSAESVSGVFHSNEASPVYVGTFIGSR